MDAGAIAWAEGVARMRETLEDTLKESPGDFPFGFEVTDDEAERCLLYVLTGSPWPPDHG
jgi:hypothetical protein